MKIEIEIVTNLNNRFTTACLANWYAVLDRWYGINEIQIIIIIFFLRNTI